jgi:hypothetical protein
MDQILRDSEGLNTLVLYNLNLKDEDCIPLKAHFERSPSITTLDLNSTPLIQATRSLPKGYHTYVMP